MLAKSSESKGSMMQAMEKSGGDEVSGEGGHERNRRMRQGKQEH